MVSDVRFVRYGVGRGEGWKEGSEKRECLRVLGLWGGMWATDTMVVGVGFVWFGLSWGRRRRECWTCEKRGNRRMKLVYW